MYNKKGKLNLRKYCLSQIQEFLKEQNINCYYRITYKRIDEDAIQLCLYSKTIKAIIDLWFEEDTTHRQNIEVSFYDIKTKEKIVDCFVPFLSLSKKSFEDGYKIVHLYNSIWL